jgi:hypothetical protein
MPATEMIVMVAVVAAMVLAFIHVLRRAVDRDPASAEGLIARLGQPAERTGDDRLSTILVATGVAMIAASVVIGDPNWMHYGIAGALFPLIIGTALWLRLFLLERARRRAGGQ